MRIVNALMKYRYMLLAGTMLSAVALPQLGAALIRAQRISTQRPATGGSSWPKPSIRSRASNPEKEPPKKAQQPKADAKPKAPPKQTGQPKPDPKPKAPPKQD